MSDICTSSSQSPSPTSHKNTDDDEGDQCSVVIVGICGSGKSTLAASLQAYGYSARQVNQEHSYVPDFWRRSGPHDALIYLDASDATIEKRIGPLLYPAVLTWQRKRLTHAKQHCQIYIITDNLNKEQVLAEALSQLKKLCSKLAQ